MFTHVRIVELQMMNMLRMPHHIDQHYSELTGVKICEWETMNCCCHEIFFQWLNTKFVKNVSMHLMSCHLTHLIFEKAYFMWCAKESKDLSSPHVWGILQNLWLVHFTWKPKELVLPFFGSVWLAATREEETQCKLGSRLHADRHGSCAACPSERNHCRCKCARGSFLLLGLLRE